MKEKLFLAKKAAAEVATGFVEYGMTIGLGTGSTTAIFAHLLGEKVGASREGVRVVPTSHQARIEAITNNLRVVGLDEVETIDLAVDGADAVDKEKNLLKGGGAAQTLEKVVDYRAKELVIIVDHTKLVENLACKPVPVETLPIAWKHVKKSVEETFDVESVVLREGSGKSGPIITDNGGFILDIKFKEITNPAKVEQQLNNLPGTLGNGIFTRKPLKVVVGKPDGTTTTL